VNPESPIVAVLRNWGKANPSADLFEYRFALSGYVFFGDLLGDYSRSQLGGYLLEEPIRIWKVGHSYEEYPQELAAWFRVPTVETRKKNIHSSEVPHPQVAEDIAALLTIFLRRLVVTVGSTSVLVTNYPTADYIPKPWPQPLLIEAQKTYSWPRLPLTVRYGEKGPEYHDNNSAIVPVSHKTLKEFLEAISLHPKADKIIAACRIYHRAMALLFQHTDASYLFFVCAAEAASKLHTADIAQSDEQLLNHPIAKAIIQKIQSLGHSPQEAREIALQIAEPYRQKKPSGNEQFRAFLEKFGAGHKDQPPLFNNQILQLFEGERQMPEAEAIDKAYQARSGFVHTAQPFSAISLLGTSNRISYQAHIDLLIGDQPAPSILWLERIISHSIRNYILTPSA
jgi:hypothetical protein